MKALENRPDTCFTPLGYECGSGPITTAVPTGTPEPSTAVLPSLATEAIGVAALRRRRKAAA